MLAAVVTDLTDGRLARRMKTASPLGGMLDSTVDFVLIYGAFIALYAAGRLAAWQFAAIYLAMLLTLATQGMSLFTGGALTRTRFGKPTGAVQYGYLLFLIAREVLPAFAWLRWVDWGIFVVLAALVLCGVVECVGLMKKSPPPATGEGDGSACDPAASTR
jgi:phosphatidylglycerophosphate synthase